MYSRNPNPKYENGFYFYCTWCWETFEKLMMKIYDFFYSAKSFSHPVKYCVKNLSRLVTPYNIVQKSLRRWKIFYTIFYGVTK